MPPQNNSTINCYFSLMTYWTTPFDTDRIFSPPLFIDFLYRNHPAFNNDGTMCFAKVEDALPGISGHGG